MSSWDSPAHPEASDAALAQSRQPVIDAGGLYAVEIANAETITAEIKLPVTRWREREGGGRRPMTSPAAPRLIRQ